MSCVWPGFGAFPGARMPPRTPQVRFCICSILTIHLTFLVLRNFFNSQPRLRVVQVQVLLSVLALDGKVHRLPSILRFHL